jgi:hypothetical protein
VKRGKRVVLILVACGIGALIAAAFWPGELFRNWRFLETESL